MSPNGPSGTHRHPAGARRVNLTATRPGPVAHTARRAHHIARPETPAATAVPGTGIEPRHGLRQPVRGAADRSTHPAAPPQAGGLSRTRSADLSSLCPRRDDLGRHRRLPRPPHLKIAGRADTLFSADAITVIHNAARGYPRAVNNLAINALTAAFARNQAMVDEKPARIAVTETGGD